MPSTRELLGLKGSIRKFVSPVSESYFSGDILRFHDSSTSYLTHEMNMIQGYATKDPHTLAQGESILLYTTKTQKFGINDYTDASGYQEFAPTIGNGLLRLKAGTVFVKVNGLNQTSKLPEQTQTTNVDFYLDSTQTKVRLRKLSSDAYGIDLGLNPHQRPDLIQINYQLERIP
jgi:hypothetical protein